MIIHETGIFAVCGDFTQRINRLQTNLINLRKLLLYIFTRGGLAALLHGVERITVDIDLSIAFDEENIDRFLNAVKKMDSNISEKDFNLNKLKSSDFNGHTDFKKLTPHQKLEWLSAMVQFYYKYSRSRKKE